MGREGNFDCTYIFTYDANDLIPFVDRDGLDYDIKLLPILLAFIIRQNATIAGILDTNLVQVGGLAQTPRDWSLDFQLITSWNIPQLPGPTNRCNIRNLIETQDSITCWGDTVPLVQDAINTGLWNQLVTGAGVRYDARDRNWNLASNTDHINLERVRGTLQTARDWSADFLAMVNSLSVIDDWDLANRCNIRDLVSTQDDINLERVGGTLQTARDWSEDFRVIWDHTPMNESEQGNVFSAYNAETITSGSSEQLMLIKNPNASGIIFYLVCIYAGSSDPSGGILRVYENPTITDDGVAITPQNLNIDHANAPVVEIYEDSTITNDGTYILVHPWNYTRQWVRGDEFPLIIPDNEYVLIRLYNLDGSTRTMYVTLVWYEL